MKIYCTYTYNIPTLKEKTKDVMIDFLKIWFAYLVWWL